MKLFEIVKNDQIGFVAGGNRANPVEAPIIGGVPRRHPDGANWIETFGDRQAKTLVDVSGMQETVTVSIVRREATARIGQVGDKRQEFEQVVLGRSLSNHDHEAGP